MSQETNCCDVWNKYQKCKAFHVIAGTKENTEKAYRFYEGDQWYGVDDNDTLPIYNIITPTVNFKVAMISMNSMNINYSSVNNSERLSKIAEMLNKKASSAWELQKMDSKCWDAVARAMIAGDSYAYFYGEKHDCQILDKTDVYFGDEQQTDIQKQPFIIISERRSVEDIIREARSNGVSEDDIANIKADSNCGDIVSTENTKREVEAEGGKCTSLLYFKLDANGDLRFCRCTEYVIYQPEQIIPDYGCYPIAPLIFNLQKGTCRGKGEVLPLIPNQIEINKNLARRILNSRINALPKLIYSSDKIPNPASLGEAGTAIEVESGTVEDVKNYISYLTPPSVSGEVINLTNELMNVTRDLAGAGDAALGNIDPTQASGAAIIAVRDQASIPLNEPTAAFRQFVEDIARIWMNTERVYNPDKLKLEDGDTVRPDELKDFNLIVRIDVSAKNPFSKYARERSLENLFTGGYISFEEYVKALDDDSSVPKAKLQEIISNRRAVAPMADNNPDVSGSGTAEDLIKEIENAKTVANGGSELVRMVEDANMNNGGGTNV